ncbi:Purine-binding protein BAB2_0673 [Mesotoga infera]|uniref:Purine-binding protein BAB2_0673 n=1 Tax=Mesotoga infera TaxID=1236046 RepID=A0A7Z7LDZ0_9BACT|nr:BMP family ABC transporter substrate-binding protein [Mesotoga infera]SSC12244.1 Purine-binding protein BAB2_0673 [Mesotoga infera]HNS66873.1 BMP family ABC transporter substrate-binding protein [Mesotoga infera]
MKVRLVFVMFVLLALSIQAMPLRVGFVYVGPTDDGGWSQKHDEGRLYLEKVFGHEIETEYAENVVEGEQDLEIMRSFAEHDFDIVFSTSFGFMDDVVEIAANYPKTIFMHCSGYKTSENLGTYFGRIYEPGYLTGLIAGSLTKSNIIGYVATFKIPEVIRGINAFAIGVEKVNPDARIHVIWTETWFDPSEEEEAAIALMDIGADIIAQSQDSPAAVQAAGNRGIYAIGYNTDMSAFSPKTFLASPVWNWGVFYERVVREVMDKKWKSYQYWGGIKDKIVDISMSSLVPQTIADIVVAEREKIISSDLHPFEGPLYDQSGNMRYAAGERPSDEELLSMDWFVRNVVGEPK